MNELSSITKFYDESASQYFDSTVGWDASPNLSRIIPYLSPGAFVVDAGCGSGRDTAWLTERGFRCYSYDASSALQQLAQKYLGEGRPVHCHLHTDLPDRLPEPADAIWSSASLLFLNDDDLAASLQALARCLRPGGLLYASFKHGTGWRKDGARWFRDMQPESGGLLATLSGLTLETVFSDMDTLGRQNQWNAFLLRKPLVP